jgi:hypothetical protein
MDLSTKFNTEIAVLAHRSDGTERDAICEWAYEPERYPTLCAYVRRGITSQTAILAAAVFEARVARLATVG